MKNSKHNLSDLENKIFGKWTVLEFSHYSLNKTPYWKCRCECGGIHSVRSNVLKNNKSSSCRSCSKIKHGLSRTPFFSLWCHINDRCHNPNNDRYYDYGGRGIFVCDEWKDPNIFTNWCKSQNYEQGMQIERLNNDGPYSPDNCEFRTTKQQARNKRNNFIVEVFGESLIFTDAVEKFSEFSVHTVYSRYSRGWAIEDALSVPLQKRKTNR